MSARETRAPESDARRARARCRAIVHGRVQGVYFRDFTRRHALHLGLVGYVRNLPPGSVEVMAEGSWEGLEALLAQLHSGPPGAEVTQVEVSWLPPSGEFRTFEVRW